MQSSCICILSDADQALISVLGYRIGSSRRPSYWKVPKAQGSGYCISIYMAVAVKHVRMLRKLRMKKIMEDAKSDS
jgi:hypothetical protein